jgi:hypothetical protein
MWVGCVVVVKATLDTVAGRIVQVNPNRLALSTMAFAELDSGTAVVGGGGATVFGFGFGVGGGGLGAGTAPPDFALME